MSDLSDIMAKQEQALRDGTLNLTPEEAQLKLQQLQQQAKAQPASAAAAPQAPTTPPTALQPPTPGPRKQGPPPGARTKVEGSTGTKGGEFGTSATRQPMSPTPGAWPTPPIEGQAPASMSALGKLKQQRAMGFAFPLLHTSIDPTDPVIARVTWPSMIHLLGIPGLLPTALSDLVNKMITDGIQETRSTQDIAKDLAEPDNPEAAWANFLELVNATCIAGFMDPPLTASREEANANPNAVLWVNDLALEDRISYFQACQRGVGAEAEALATFPEPVPVVDTGQDGQEVWVSSEPVPIRTTAPAE